MFLQKYFLIKNILKYFLHFLYHNIKIIKKI